MPYTVTHCLPELDERERSFVERLTTGMSEADVKQFAIAYRQERKDSHAVLLMAVIGIVAVPGLHRFALGQVGMGFLYLLTYGLLLIGTITDIVRHRELTLTYNRQVARRIASNLGHSERAAWTGREAPLSRDPDLRAETHHPA